MRVPLNRTRRLLFLAYFFPPANMSGCVRTWNIAKYLARLGWDIVVVTLQPSIWRYVEDVARTDAKIKEASIHRILTDHRTRWLSPQFLNCRNGNYGRLVGGIGRRVAAHLGIDKGVGWIKEAESLFEFVKGRHRCDSRHGLALFVLQARQKSIGSAGLPLCS